MADMTPRERAEAILRKVGWATGADAVYERVEGEIIEIILAAERAAYERAVLVAQGYGNAAISDEGAGTAWNIEEAIRALASYEAPKVIPTQSSEG